MFSQPNFTSLGLKRVRYLVPWDWQRQATQIAEMDQFISAAGRHELLITFTARRGCFDNGKYSKSKACRAPSYSKFKKSMLAFRKRYPKIKVFAPWNEVNHVSQPTAKSPKRAAGYYNVMRKSCKKCKLVAADVLDQSNVKKYLKKFLRYAKGKPRRWGLHNYSDVNRKRSKGTIAVLKTVRGEVWLTETGGVVSFLPSFKYSQSRAASRTKYMFKLADKYSKKRRGYKSRIKRVYPYSWTGSPAGARFDAGFTEPDGTPRKAYFTFKSLVKKRSK